jgi:hypothetical protein
MQLYKEMSVSEKSESGLAEVRIHLASVYTTCGSASIKKAANQLRKLEQMWRSGRVVAAKIRVNIDLLHRRVSEMIKSDPDLCQACGEEDAEMACACAGANYCNATCQAKAWPVHKEVCTAPQYIEYKARA